MKLEKLQTLLSEVQREFIPEYITAELFYYFNDVWTHLNGNQPPSSELIACLRNAKSDSFGYHVPRDKRAWFAFPDYDCTVSLEFGASPRIDKRKSSRIRIANAFLRASNAYKVGHNALTQLFGTEAFVERLEAALKSIAPSTSSPVQESAPSQSIVVLALDIDHFKQVNDTYSHRYGNQVLRIFGLRIEKLARELERLSSGSINITVGHPSGEEFLVFIAGGASRDQLDHWANDFLKCISASPLPNESEWQWLHHIEDVSQLTLPPPNERIITTSIGASRYEPTMQTRTFAEQATQLRDQADTALYRAKAAGRNQVIFFDTILSSCGRVLEQDAQTKVVAIDIGQNVGVVTDQEFRVFPIGFTGARKFTVSDGRSTRVLGTYPRIELTRITVFNVQPEISFAFISDTSESQITVDPGCTIEAIPIGSISHLLPQSVKYLADTVDSTKLGGIEPLQAFIRSESEKSSPFAAVFRFSRAEQYRKQYGGAAQNAALTRVFRAVTSTFHAGSATGLLDPSSICVVGKKHIYDEKVLQSLVERLGDELPEIGLTVGVFCSDDNNKTPANNSTKLLASNAIEYARFSASDYALLTGRRLIHFSFETALRILKTQSEAGAFALVAADYEKFQLLGVDNGNLSNYGGLAYSRIGKLKEQVASFSRAVDFEPSNLIFRSNFGTATFASGETDRGLAVLAEITDAQLPSLETQHPYGYLCYAALLARARAAGSARFDLPRFSVMSSRALALAEYPKTPGFQVVAEQAAAIAASAI